MKQKTNIKTSLSLDSLCDNLKRDGWSYGYVNYIDPDGQLWLQVDAEKGGEMRFYRAEIAMH